LLDAGRRPVLIVSRELLNRGDYAVIVAFTSSRLSQRRQLPNCVFFRAGEFGLSSDCVAQCETISTVHADQLDAAAGPIGKLDDLALRSIIKAIGYVIASDCEPD
jgi:mRNA-degrading endonuclease toxin of MazEF toxin-antitoxin module